MPSVRQLRRRDLHGKRFLPTSKGQKVLTSGSNSDHSGDDDISSTGDEYGRSSRRKNSQRLLAYKRASLGAGSLATSLAELRAQYARARVWYGLKLNRATKGRRGTAKVFVIAL